MKPTPTQGKPLPPKFRFQIKFGWFRTFTPKERLLIALGHNFNLDANLLSVNSPGHVQPVFIGSVSRKPIPEPETAAPSA